MSDIDINISEEDLEGQVERLQNELDYDYYESQQLYNHLRQRVVQGLEQRDRKWNTEMIDSFTHLLIAIQIRTQEEVEGDIPEYFDVFKNVSAS